MKSQNGDIQRYVDLMGVEKIKKKAGIKTPCVRSPQECKGRSLLRL